jgi:hypothetical protein
MPGAASFTARNVDLSEIQILPMKLQRHGLAKVAICFEKFELMRYLDMHNLKVRVSLNVCSVSS